jgi:hypothetical protein
MTAVTPVTKPTPIPAELEREILARIDSGGLHICEAELRDNLKWDERTNGSLFELLDELEQQGLIESAIHFRLTKRGHTQLPDGYKPLRRYGTGIPWEVRR